MIERRFFEYDKVKKMVHSDTTPIKSQFKLSINTVLNLIKQHNEKEIGEILSKSFHSFQKYGKDFLKRENVISHNAFYNHKKKLERMGYVKNNKLTEKGEFSSNIYSDEILAGEIFATDFYKQLNEYQMLMIVACLCYEARERTEFYKKYPSNLVDKLKNMLWRDDFLRREKRFRELDELTAIAHPCYHGRDLFSILENTNLLEGDVLRFLRQVIDKLGQIKSATQDKSLRDMLDNCQQLVNNCVKDFGIV